MASVHFSVGSWYGVRHATDRKPRLQVMITTSHSAPYEATSDESRIGLVDAWVKSKNVDYLSPQLYTTGGEGAEFQESTGILGSVGYEHYIGAAKAKFVPSIVSESQVDEVREFFAGKGIVVDGFIQWQQSAPRLEHTGPLSSSPTNVLSRAGTVVPTADWTRTEGPRCQRTPTRARRPRRSPRKSTAWRTASAKKEKINLLKLKKHNA